ncbi:MAG: hypothetical protein ACRCT9_13155, partial [Roseinatronobacter monicus]
GMSSKADRKIFIVVARLLGVNPPSRIHLQPLGKSPHQLCNLKCDSPGNSIGIGASYTMDAMTISAGVQYTRIGSATTTLNSQFSNNSAIGAGVRVGFSF